MTPEKCSRTRLLSKYPHPFPARMAPSLVFDELRCQPPGLRVLDPMAGSGITLAAARLCGHKATGFDTDPLAVLISQVICTEVEHDAVRRAAKSALYRAEQWLLARPLKGKSYPEDVDEETKNFIRYWFDLHNRRELTALSRSILKIRNSNVQKLLWCAFSRLIIAKSRGVSLASDIAHSRPHRTYSKPPIKPFEHFMGSVDHVLAAIPFQVDNGLHNVEVYNEDARSMPVHDASFDYIVTSPPYLNAIDYMRGHKFSLIWQGHSIDDLRKIRSENVGTERIGNSTILDGDIRLALRVTAGNSAIANHKKAVLLKYLADMKTVIKEAHRVLVPNGTMFLVVGDSMHQGIPVKNSRGITTLAKRVGFALVKRSSRPIPDCRRYLPPPKTNCGKTDLDGRMRREVILKFQKLIIEGADNVS